MPTPRPHGSRRRRRTTTSTQAGKCRPAARSEPNELGRFRTEQAVALLAPIPRQTATPPPSEAALAAAARRGSGECGATSSTPSPARSSRPCLHTFAAAVTWPRPSAGGSSGTVARSRPRVRPSAELGSVGAHRERSAGCASSSSSSADNVGVAITFSIISVLRLRGQEYHDDHPPPYPRHH